MKFNVKSIIRKPLMGLALMAFCLSLVQAITVTHPNVKSPSPIVKAFFSNVLHVEMLASDHSLEHQFGKHSENCPNSEEESESQKTEKDDIQGFLFVKNLQTQQFVQASKAQDNRDYRLLKVESVPLYMLHHSWKSHLS